MIVVAQEIAIRWSATALTVMLSVMLPRSPDTDAFWQAFRRYAGLDHDNYVVGSFGDSPEMATELADLVIAGIERARPAWPETTGKVASRHRGSAISSSCQAKGVQGSFGEPPR
jgi:hypothetical protein